MKKNIFIASFFIALTFIFTHPLILKIRSVIPGAYTTDESFAWLAYFWWLKYAVTHHLAATYNSIIAVPFGIDMSKQIFHPGWNFLCVWLSVLTDNVVSFNIQILLSFILSGITMFYLVFALTKDKFSSLFAGIIYAFCPYHFARAWQHLSLTNIQWMPLYILTLIKLQEHPKYKNFFLSIGAIFLVISFEFHYTYFMYITSVLFLIYCVIFYKKVDARYWRFLKLTLFIMTAGVVLVMSTAAGPSIKKVIFKKETIRPLAWNLVRPLDDLFFQSARPLSYFLPATAHPLFGGFTEQFIGSSLYGGSLTEHTLYLGWVPMILAFVAFRAFGRNRKAQGGSSKSGDRSLARENFYIGFFIFLAIGAWLFSQPPWWNVGPFKIYMPSFFMYRIFPMFRAYCRFGIVLMLAVAVLAGFGLKYILERFKSRRSKAAIAILFCGAVLFEFWNWPPYKVIDVSSFPAVYSWLKEQPADTVAAEYPLDADSPNEMYKFYQTKHGKKIINGTNPGTYAHEVAQEIKDLSKSDTAGILKWMGVKYVIVHRAEFQDTGIIAEQNELVRIPANPGLKLVRSFPEQGCPRQDIMCIQKTGPIDVYEVIATSIQPRVKE